MATRFELLIHGDDAVRLRAAGEEALGEIERLDRQLSPYSPESDVALVNARAAESAVKMDPRIFRLLVRARELSARTRGAFDITVAPLMRVWGLMQGSGHLPDERELERAMEVVGVQHVLLDQEAFTVRFDRPGVKLDLGAIGKGYAVERAVGILVEHGVTSALLHGGTSTIYGIGVPPDMPTWRVAIRHPLDENGTFATVDLKDSALSVSAPYGKSFSVGEQEYGHVIDPRTGRPTSGTISAAVVGPSPADSDALSTALLVLGPSGLGNLPTEYGGIVAVKDAASGIGVSSIRL